MERNYILLADELMWLSDSPPNKFSKVVQLHLLLTCLLHWLGIGTVCWTCYFLNVKDDKILTLLKRNKTHQCFIFLTKTTGRGSIIHCSSKSQIQNTTPRLDIIRSTHNQSFMLSFSHKDRNIVVFCIRISSHQFVPCQQHSCAERQITASTSSQG